MKKHLLLLCATCLLTLPVAVRADDHNTLSKKSSAALAKAVKTAAIPKTTRRPQTIYYITSQPHTGSAIPMVYRQYNGRLDSASSAAVYGQERLRFTGSDDLATSLSMLDTSISIGRH